MNPFQRSMSLPDLYELRNTMEDRGAPQYQLDNIDRFITAEEQRLAELAAGGYSKTADRGASELTTITRVADELLAYAEEVKQALADGRVVPTDAAKHLAGINRDLGKLRQQIELAVTSEDKAWAEVDKSPEEYRADIVRRMPSLDSRMRVSLSEDELTQRPARRRRGESAPAPDADELERGGYRSRGR